jgi:hypothetical protein
MGRAEGGGDGGLHVLLGDAHGWRSGDSLSSRALSVCSGGAKASKRGDFQFGLSRLSTLFNLPGRIFQTWSRSLQNHEFARHDVLFFLSQGITMLCLFFQKP